MGVLMDDRITEIREAIRRARIQGSLTNANFDVLVEAAEERLALLDSDALIIRRDTLRDFIERMVGFYQADAATNPHRLSRREAQTIALAEVLRFLDGDLRCSHQVADFVPIGLTDLPPRLGGVPALASSQGVEPQ